MKLLHTSTLYAWSRFDEARNIDFNSVLWVREGGNVAIDPLPMSEHDREHLKKLGGAAWIIITNSDHVRDAAALKDLTCAKIAGPAAEKASFPIPCDMYLENGSEVVPGLEVIALSGSKTPGELALVIDGATLVTGDLVRCHRGGALHLLPDEKLTDATAARASVRALAQREKVDAVIVGDGWPMFRGGHAALQALSAT